MSTMRESVKSMKWMWVAIALFMGVGGSGIGVWLFQKDSTAIAYIDGRPISLKMFQVAVQKEEQYYRQLRAMGLNIEHKTDPQMVLRSCALSALLEKIAADIGLDISEAGVRKAILKAMPKHIFNTDGSVNLGEYSRMINHAMGLKVSEFEQEQEGEMLQGVVKSILASTHIKPHYVTELEKAEKGSLKSFEYIKMPLSKYINAAVSTGISEEELHSYFEQYQDRYQTDPYLDLRAFVIKEAVVAGSIKVGADEIESYYNRNRMQKYFTPAKYSVDFAELDASQMSKQELEDAADKLIASGKNLQSAAQAFERGVSYRAEKDILLGRGKLPDAVETAVLKLDVGKMSGKIEVGNKVYVALLVAKQASVQKELKDVKSEIEKLIKDRRVGYELDRLSSFMQRALQDDYKLSLAQLQKVVSEINSTAAGALKEEGVQLLPEASKQASEVQAALHSKLGGKISSLTQGAVGGVHTKSGRAIYTVEKAVRADQMSFKQAKMLVEQDLMFERGKQAWQKSLLSAYNLLHKGMSLQEVSQNFGVKVERVSTANLEEAQKVSSLEKWQLEQAFRARDIGQVVKAEGDEEAVLFILKNKQQAAVEKVEKQDSHWERESEEHRYLSAVLAGLLENAKLEIVNRMVSPN